MLENANIAFSIAVATVVILLYITYNLLFRKNSFVSKETQIQASTTETGQADDQVRPVKQQKEKKQNQVINRLAYLHFVLLLYLV